MLTQFPLLANSLSEQDLNSLTFADLHYMYGIGESQSTGSGRNKEYSYRHSVKTEVGNIEENHWCKLMEQLIKRSDEKWLLDALIQWGQEHNYARASPSDIRKEALQLHSHRIFDDPQWVCFLPFNRRFRPDALADAHIVRVVNECCGLPGEVTQEQVDRAHGDSISCPHCGRWSSFSICPINTDAKVSGSFDQIPPWADVE